MHAYMLQRLFESSVQPNACNFFLDLLIRWIGHLLSTCGIWLVGISFVIHVLQLEKMNFCSTYTTSLSQADIQNLFDAMPRRMAALIAERSGYTKY
ncbi:uncharacterized protein TNCV_4902691 [Trichonephila clavipes]|nr:uncharacterized protein TNCV_4902691 [Trichonephila clavipes]